MPVQVSSSSFHHGSELRGPSPMTFMLPYGVTRGGVRRGWCGPPPTASRCIGRKLDHSSSLLLAVTETAGEYLTNAILGELEKNGLDIQNCWGEGYDNGADMSDRSCRLVIARCCECVTVPLRHGDALNSRRAASLLVRLVKGKKRWEIPDPPPKGVLTQNWSGTEPNRIVACMVLKATANDRCAS
ncbi:hypothetical protein TNCV_2336811 [Trichonephila clavipes]|nr:hypothetical protein TNCV_2336811 [Trichonephila clavipes]